MKFGFIILRRKYGRENLFIRKICEKHIWSWKINNNRLRILCKRKWVFSDLMGFLQVSSAPTAVPTHDNPMSNWQSAVSAFLRTMRAFSTFPERCGLPASLVFVNLPHTFHIFSSEWLGFSAWRGGRMRGFLQIYFPLPWADRPQQWHLSPHRNYCQCRS